MNRARTGVISVEVPASAANLGPGFDTLGLALGLYDRVEVEIAPAGPAGIRVEVTGEGSGELPTGEDHLVVRAALATMAALGAGQPGGLVLRCHNRIPHSRGLGSSAAATVAGVAAGYALAGVELDGTERAGRALQLAAAFEGHADNAAPSLLGGLTVSWSGARAGADAAFHAVRLDPHHGLVPVLLVPSVQSSTAYTRGLLPSHVPHADAVFNIGRAALLVHALVSRPRPELLLDGTGDRMHQPYRRTAYPATAALVDALRAHGVPAVVSGAGPSVLALTCGEPLPDAVDMTGFDVRPLTVDRSGVRIQRSQVSDSRIGHASSGIERLGY